MSLSRHSTGEPSQTKATKRPRFFRIILQPNELAIPKKFAVLHGKELSDIVTLEFPCGSSWRIGLENRDGNTLLCDGWATVMRQHSIEIGHMLVFVYEGDSTFSISVFDRTCYEVDYPAIDPKGKSRQAKPEKTKKKKGIPLVKAKTSKFRFLARDFSCLREPHFKVLMQKTYVLGSRMSVPVSFAQRHLQENCRVILNGSDGGSWEMEYNKGVYNKQQLYASPKFHSGWRKFVQENKLGVGDFCVFFMRKDCGEVSFDVTIFRPEDCN